MCRPALPVLRKLSHRPDQARHIAAIGPPGAWARSTSPAPVCSARALHTPAFATPTDTGLLATGSRVCWPSGHDADTLRATAWSSDHGLRPPLCFQQSGFTQPALRVYQSERWSAVTGGPASLRIVLTVVVHRSACHTLRFYITPHLPKRPSIHSQARSMAERRFAPFGFGKQALCKVSCTGGSPRFACFPVGAPTPPYARAPVPARGLQAL